MNNKPERTRVSTSFSPGPQRVESGEVDETFEYRPVGFTTVSRCSVTHTGLECVGKCEHYDPPENEPLLWEGDQT